jgi:hypothetical protein
MLPERVLASPSVDFSSVAYCSMSSVYPVCITMPVATAPMTRRHDT